MFFVGFGFLAGGTQDAELSAMIPGLLSLVSGSAFLVFHRETRMALPVGITVITFSVNLLAGVVYGQIARDIQLRSVEAERQAAAEEVALEQMRQDALLERERRFLEAEIQVQVDRYRERLGLGPDPTPVILEPR